jgi:hypothetical protein
MSNNVFVIDDLGSLRKMELMNYSTEDEFQELIAQFPSLISGSSDQTDKNKYLLIKREIGVPEYDSGSSRWSLDHLFINQEGIPVLVEVKRSTDTRLRREVVGQMLDYAANAVAYWPLEFIQNSFDQECEKNGVNSEEHLREFLGEAGSVESFWMTVKTNLKAGRVKMLFVADEIPNELKRIIEFLNEQMDPAEVLGVQVKQFANENFKAIIPSIFGQTSSAQSRKSSQKSGPDEFLEEVVNIFNGKSNQFKAAGAGWSYRQVKVPGFPAKLHYEFLSRKSSGVTAEFHIESVEYKELALVLEKMVNDISSINGGKLEFDPSWNNGLGRIRVLHKDFSSEVAADTMLALIAATKQKIESAVKNAPVNKIV